MAIRRERAARRCSRRVHGSRLRAAVQLRARVHRRAEDLSRRSACSCSPGCSGCGPSGSVLAGTAYGFNLLLVAWIRFPHSSIWVLIPWAAPVNGAGRAAPEQANRLRARRGDGTAVPRRAPGVKFHRDGDRRGRRDAADCDTRSPRRGSQRPAPAWPGPRLIGRRDRAGGDSNPSIRRTAREVDRRVPPAEHDAAASVQGHRRPDDALLSGRWDQPSVATGRDLSSIYIGALPLLLAAAALVGRRSAQQRWIAAFGLVCLLVALGVQPLFWIVHLLPASIRPTCN